MDWTRITNKLFTGKKQEQEISLEPLLQNYFTQMKAELNIRLLCEADAENGADLFRSEFFQVPEQVLWIENIILTDCERQPCRKKEKKGKSGSRWESIKNRLLGFSHKRQKERK